MEARGKRWLTLIAVLAAASLVFAACGEDEEPSAPAGNETEDAGDGAEFTTVDEGVLTVGSDIPYPPFEFEEADGTLTGFDVELVRAVAEKLGLENPDDAWVSTDFGTIFQQLRSGTKFDIVVAAVTAYAPEGSPAAETVADRREVVDFTDPYYPSLQSLTVPTDSDIQSTDDVDGARVAVQRATTGAFFAEENLAGAELVSFEKAPQMYQALLAGQVDAVFNDLPVSLDAIKDKPDLEVIQQVETGEEYAIAVAKENPALTEAINEALAELFEDGTYAEIFEKYFPDQELPPYASE
ncbi:MAG: basic amino acid ABC transporter substrate-binding protein [Actinomycetota bacterium]|nr:basic amino acid ABC transporter substrate-binding protein [Actinomycetota bacterium]